jgi:hypothetical protein
MYHCRGTSELRRTSRARLNLPSVERKYQESGARIASANFSTAPPMTGADLRRSDYLCRKDSKMTLAFESRAKFSVLALKSLDAFQQIAGSVTRCAPTSAIRVATCRWIVRSK